MGLTIVMHSVQNNYGLGTQGKLLVFGVLVFPLLWIKLISMLYYEMGCTDIFI